MKNKYLRILAFFIVLLLVANIVLLALRIISVILFWAIIIVAGIFAYFYLPRIKK